MKEITPCPMCGDRFDNRTDLRVHLMCDHRKSALTEELLAAVETKHDLYETLRKRQPIPVGEQSTL